jgi:hypothetical protein
MTGLRLAGNCQTECEAKVKLFFGGRALAALTVVGRADHRL